MKWWILIFLVGAAALLYLFIGGNNVSKKSINNPNSAVAGEASEPFHVIADDLYVPWDIAFLPEGDILVVERSGGVLLVTEAGKREIYRVGSYESGEGGLLGMTLHPQFAENGFLYLYYTHRSLQDGTTRNKVERYRYQGETLVEPSVIIDSIPGARYHDGGRIAFGPDTHLYITTGDAEKPELAQDTNSLAGKILRLQDDGFIPKDNPFANSPVYSYGHRNPQGLTWDTEGRLWSTEHGRSGPQSGFDEINLILSGGNYGWPDSQGNVVAQGTKGPILHSGAHTTWAPASTVFYRGSIYFGGLRGEAVYEALIAGNTVVDVKGHYHKQFGRIRTVKIGPDDMLYITTSNRDNRGTIREGDDRVIRVSLP